MRRRLFRSCEIIVVLFFALLIAQSHARAAIVINEFMAAPSERQLSWSGNGVPRLGSGFTWFEPEFAPDGWLSGNLPAGYGFSGLATDLTSTMRDKAPSLYLRREFDVTPTQAALTANLSLQVEYNDGFVAYLNGREVARANCGASNRFMFAAQPAFNVSTAIGLAELNLGPVNTLLVPGRNVFAIQAHNAEQPSTTGQPDYITRHIATLEFKINAGLRTDGGVPLSLAASSFDFNNAAGGAKTHANTNGVVTDTTTGTLAPNGWLASAANPVSAATWQGLGIVAAELPGIGPGGSGALRYTINQTGPSQSVALRAPTPNMTGAWNPGAVSAANLASTILRFRYRATGGTQFGLRIDPALGQEANALSGFPIIGTAAPPAAVSFSNVVGGARVMTVNSSGAQIQSQTGTLVSPALFAFTSSDVRNMTYRIVEESGAGAGNGGSTGHLRGEITQAASAGTSWGFNYANIAVSNWTAGSVTTQELGYVTFQFACKIPAGVSFQISSEPGNGSPPNRLEWGSITGDGTWQIIQRDFATAAGAENFRTTLNAMNSRNFKFVVQGPANLSAGTWIQLDDFQIIPWHKYEIHLADAASGQSAFLNYLNANNSISFVPTFMKLSDAPPGGQTLTIDDYEIAYFGTNSSGATAFIPTGAAGGPWNYFVGRAEPSGGVFDSGLLTNIFAPPTGEEDDFEQPAAFVDWIELFNADAVAVNLSGWSLTDERDTPAKWRFPTNAVIPAKGYLLVLCDDREEANAPGGPATRRAHLNF